MLESARWWGARNPIPGGPSWRPALLVALSERRDRLEAYPTLAAVPTATMHPSGPKLSGGPYSCEIVQSHQVKV